ncbi:YveK family protein [Clostridium tarantellae]|uniref:Capsular biosynthesis protein n=1 Tax=Clostridium tarantellae TaxID=39493 RepID=A0A6I1MFK9_9CLOT|nr:Wzz/FepE/Etk N-terminal domain-containing protein [Clostridium tarantellae]MPQ42286.1 capsular biosynthesis protein [Clostridium tarantellae]
MEEKTLKIDELLYTIKKRYKIIILVTASMTILATLFAFFKMKPQYFATTKVFVGRVGDSKNYSTSELETYKTLMSTYVDLIRTEDVVAKALNDSGIKKSAKAVLGSMQLAPNEASPILTIKVIGTSEKDARVTTEALLKGFDNITKEVLTTAKIDVIDSTKTYTVMPNRKKVLIMGFIVGLIISLGVVFVLDYLDNTIKTTEELEELLNLPVVGIIPNEDEV